MGLRVWLWNKLSVIFFDSSNNGCYNFAWSAWNHFLFVVVNIYFYNSAFFPYYYIVPPYLSLRFPAKIISFFLLEFRYYLSLVFVRYYWIFVLIPPIIHSPSSFPFALRTSLLLSTPAILAANIQLSIYHFHCLAYLDSLALLQLH